MAERLTPFAVRAAKPDPNRRIEIPDGGSGLYLVIQPSGAKSWAIRYRHDKKSVKLTLGPVLNLEGKESEPEGEPQRGRPLTLKGARVLAASLLRRVAHGFDPADEQRRDKAASGPGQPALDVYELVAVDFIQRYCKTANRQSSWKETARLLGFRPDPADPAKLVARVPKPGTFAGVAHYWRGRRIGELQRGDVVALLDEIADGGAPFSANRTFAAVRRLFNWCVERGLIEVSPCAGVKPPTTEVSRDRVLSDEELSLIWRAADRIGDPFGPFIKMLVLTGQRRDEVAEMTWHEVSHNQGLWSLPRERVKNDTAHEVPLSEQAVAVLTGVLRLKGKPDYVFSTGSGRTKAEGSAAALVPISGFSKAKRQLDAAVEALRREQAARAGEDASSLDDIPSWRLHDLRRTAASGMARLSVPLPVIEKVLNHLSGSFAGVAGVYNKYSFSDEKRDALQRWANYVQGLHSAPLDD